MPFKMLTPVHVLGGVADWLTAQGADFIGNLHHFCTCDLKMDPFPSPNGRSNHYFCRLDAFSHLRSWGSLWTIFHGLQNRAQTIGGSHFFKKCDSPGGLVHTFSRVLPLGFYALWYFFGALALEVLQKKKVDDTSNARVPLLGQTL